MKQERQTAEGTILSLIIINEDKNSLTPAQKLSCCRQFFEALEIEGYLPGGVTSYEVDAWGHRSITGPAFPSSLFLSDEGLLKLLRQCNDKNDLLVLHADNRERVENNTGLKRAFIKREQSLKGRINI